MWRRKIGSNVHALRVGRPVIIGIYGLPGSGKTFLMEKLKQVLPVESYIFCEGSEVISRLIAGGITAFQSLSDDEKVGWRELAINTIRADCMNDGKAGVVTGHHMFWSDRDTAGVCVTTQEDLKTYTHIIYLDVPPQVIIERRERDSMKSRPPASIDHLRRWQSAEKSQLRRACYSRGIIFSVLGVGSTEPLKVVSLIECFCRHGEKDNLSSAQTKLDHIIEAHDQDLKSILVLDADRTLSPLDAGALFWGKIRQTSGLETETETDPLKELFSGPLGYSYDAFFQATLLYAEWADDHTYEVVCTDLAARTTLYPDIASLLRLVKAENHATAIIITCGLRLFWEKVLEREELFDKIKVIGGGRLADNVIVNAAVKAALVARLQKQHGLHVSAFGDSVLDLDMLCQADQAIVVVGDEQSRSRSMDAALDNAIVTEGLQARQTLLATNASPRLDTNKLPLIRLGDAVFLDSVLPHRRCRSTLKVIHLTKSNAAKILMTPMRDAGISGPRLREAHRRTGWYLANSALPDVVGVEEFRIPHVQGHHTTGYRLADEQRTLIVALMRGGEAMGFGVNDAFPLASFLHAKRPEDITAGHLKDVSTVVLVDSVVNSGQTMVDFLQRVHHLEVSVRIVMVAGVAQRQSIGKLEKCQAALQHQNVCLIALRTSDNQFTGHGGTDTGNRLFNTTKLV
ncbi:hypothetical protein LTR96_011093 [Exophiala xenobiotica]|nr:hypothetical protein LTR96_011093 [Exophiala xenobiotica]KAK5332753.1 hypothetical protein LTR98_011125 [Exophiala xenobiotica]